jgi:hypothetical protein
MDEAERAIEIALAASHGDKYGTADVSPRGFDRSQMRRNRLLTPAERLEQLARAVRFVQSYRGAARRSPR